MCKLVCAVLLLSLPVSHLIYRSLCRKSPERHIKNSGLVYGGEKYITRPRARPGVHYWLGAPKRQRNGVLSSTQKHTQKRLKSSYKYVSWTDFTSEGAGGLCCMASKHFPPYDFDTGPEGPDLKFYRRKHKAKHTANTRRVAHTPEWVAMEVIVPVQSGTHFRALRVMLKEEFPYPQRREPPNSRRFRKPCICEPFLEQRGPRWNRDQRKHPHSGQ